MEKKVGEKTLPTTFYQMSVGNTGAAFVHGICHVHILLGPTVMLLTVYLN